MLVIGIVDNWSVIIAHTNCNSKHGIPNIEYRLEYQSFLRWLEKKMKLFWAPVLRLWEVKRFRFDSGYVSLVNVSKKRREK